MSLGPSPLAGPQMPSYSVMEMWEGNLQRRPGGCGMGAVVGTTLSQTSLFIDPNISLDLFLELGDFCYVSISRSMLCTIFESSYILKGLVGRKKPCPNEENILSGSTVISVIMQRLFLAAFFADSELGDAWLKASLVLQHFLYHHPKK